MLHLGVETHKGVARKRLLFENNGVPGQSSQLRGSRCKVLLHLPSSGCQRENRTPTSFADLLHQWHQLRPDVISEESLLRIGGVFAPCIPPRRHPRSQPRLREVEERPHIPTSPRSHPCQPGNPRSPKQVYQHGLDLVIERELIRFVDEGRYHRGQSAVVQILAFKR